MSSSSSTMFATQDLKRFFTRFVETAELPTMAVLDKEWSKAVNNETKHDVKAGTILWDTMGGDIARLVMRVGTNESGCTPRRSPCILNACNSR